MVNNIKDKESYFGEQLLRWHLFCLVDLDVLTVLTVIYAEREEVMLVKLGGG